MRQEVIHQMRVHYYYQRLLEYVLTIFMYSVISVKKQHFDCLVFFSVRQCGHHLTCQNW